MNLGSRRHRDLRLARLRGIHAEGLRVDLLMTVDQLRVGLLKFELSFEELLMEPGGLLLRILDLRE